MCKYFFLIPPRKMFVVSTHYKLITEALLMSSANMSS